MTTRVRIEASPGGTILDHHLVRDGRTSRDLPHGLAVKDETEAAWHRHSLLLGGTELEVSVMEVKDNGDTRVVFDQQDGVVVSVYLSQEN